MAMTGAAFCNRRLRLFADPGPAQFRFARGAQAVEAVAKNAPGTAGLDAAAFSTWLELRAAQVSALVSHG